MLENIPLELRQYPHWVVWRYEVVDGRKTKVPYSANGLTKADTKNPATWGTFTDAVQATQTGTMDGVGFVFSDNDPYSGIDIDDKDTDPASEAEKIVHAQVLQHFASYTERSPGGRGYHIIIRGKIPNGQRGRDYGHIGVYSRGRYFTFTGDVVRNAPIGDYQSLLDRYIASIPETGTVVDLVQEDGFLTDRQVWDMAAHAANGSGEKFVRLWNGDWQTITDPVTGAHLYKSSDGKFDHSKADHALICLLAYYTRDNEQVTRMFRQSGMADRQKAWRPDYIARTLEQFRAKQPSATDLNIAAENARAIIASQMPRPPMPEPPRAEMPRPAMPLPTVANGVPLPPLPDHIEPIPADDSYFPPGLVGDIAQYIFASSGRPVQQASLCYAIAFVAGVAGRCYNISGTGLNQYLLFVAKTGVGKDDGPKAINRLIAAVRTQIPMVDDCIGPGSFASGQGLIRALDKQPCFASVLGEFGFTLQEMSDPRSPPAVIVLKRVLLDLYSKSGWRDVLRSSVYSDVEKNTKSVHAPNVTLIGDATPESFFDNVSANDIAEGLIPRFHVAEYTGKRLARNKHAYFMPAQELVHRIADLVGGALTMKQNNSCAQIPMQADAEQFLDTFDTECDSHINNALGAGESQLWNRAHLKSLKLAGLIAVGVNPRQPVVTLEIAQWAINFVRHGTERLLARFFTGDVGSGDAKQMNAVKELVREYLAMNKQQLNVYKVPHLMKDNGVIPYSFFINRCSRMAAFYRDRKGATEAIKRTLDTMVASEMLAVCDAVTAYQRFNARQKCFYVASSFH